MRKYQSRGIFNANVLENGAFYKEVHYVRTIGSPVWLYLNYLSDLLYKSRYNPEHSHVTLSIRRFWETVHSMTKFTWDDQQEVPRGLLDLFYESESG
jgi:hypothetical protein